MAEELNATCAICGTKYHMCGTCRDTISYMPWRTITDTTNCYKIYMIIYEYNHQIITKKQAKEMLENVTMPSQFQPHIEKAINKIMAEDPKTEKVNTKIKYKKGVSVGKVIENNE